MTSFSFYFSIFSKYTLEQVHEISLSSSHSITSFIAAIELSAISKTKAAATALSKTRVPTIMPLMFFELALDQPLLFSKHF